jgi:hypothetical protein
MSNALLDFRARAFGLNWSSRIHLEHFLACSDNHQPFDVRVETSTNLSARRAMRHINRGFVCEDGFRFVGRDEACFDMRNGNVIDVVAGPRWKGSMPWSFYSTVTALLLAWRGLLPLHASSVAIDGQGILICGPSGAGKSSLVASLVAEGATLLSDDLSVVASCVEPNDYQLLPGRPGIRLLPDMAQWFTTWTSFAIPGDHRSKVMCIPASGLAEKPAPLACIVVLGSSAMTWSSGDRMAILGSQLFRPGWMGVLPGAEKRETDLQNIVTTVDMISRATTSRLDGNPMGREAASLIAEVRRRSPKAGLNAVRAANLATAT